MEKKDEKPKANKLRGEDENIKTNDLPYDPEVNDDDMLALHKDGLNIAPDEDRHLENRERPVDFSGKDLDIPPREERNTNTAKEIPDPDNYQWNDRGAKNQDAKRTDGPDPDKKI